MFTETVKKYTLTEEEISAIKITLDVVRGLCWEDFDSYGAFFNSSLCFVDILEHLERILENNGKNLE